MPPFHQPKTRLSFSSPAPHTSRILLAPIAGMADSCSRSDPDIRFYLIDQVFFRILSITFIGKAIWLASALTKKTARRRLCAGRKRKRSNLAVACAQTRVAAHLPFLRESFFGLFLFVSFIGSFLFF
ncbi:hypothetical protein [Pandoravirus japonicus]|uniref:Uncharacterized protein n=1 Tax=Pandoravirus japonicus TaxID=2823154 RepID=A0A811BM14_9VIRU|nr:hypothetical protein [Pandoravirus japonicus]